MRPAFIAQGSRIVIEVGAPTGIAVSTATTGGSIAASTTNTYQVSALYPWGESAPSAPVSVTTGSGTATNENTISWTLPTGAIAAKVYGRTSGSELFIAQVAAGTSSYTDTGSVTPSGALPTGTFTLTEAEVNADILSIQGALTAQTTLVFPLRPQKWVISNETTGAYVVDLETSGTTAISVGQGTAYVAYCNGTALELVQVQQAVNATNVNGGTINATTGAFSGEVTAPSLDISGNITAGSQTTSGDQSIDGTLTVDGATSLQAVTATTGAFSGALTVQEATAASNPVQLQQLTNGTLSPVFDAPELVVTNSDQTITPTLSSSTTGGSIAASTTYFYAVLPVLESGPTFFYAPALSTSIETGSGTSTNSNAISWSAYSGAASYNVYRGTAGGVSGLGTYGLIGNTTSTSFTDTGQTAGAGLPGSSNQAFTVMPFSSVVTDTANGWDISNNSYTIPKTGKWLVISNLRYQDDSPSGISYSLNANSSVADSPSDLWFMTPTPASGQTARQGAVNARIANFTQGETVSMFSYAGEQLFAQTSSLTLLYFGA